MAMAIQIIPIAQSTNIQQVGYDDESGDLIVKFVRMNTPTYIFHQVPQSVVDGFTRAESPGVFFRGNVLNQFQHDTTDQPSFGQ